MAQYVTATFSTTATTWDISGQTLTFTGNAAIADTGTNADGIIGSSDNYSTPSGSDETTAKVSITPEYDTGTSNITLNQLTTPVSSDDDEEDEDYGRVFGFDVAGVTAGGEYYSEADILEWANNSDDYTGADAPDDLTFLTVSGEGTAILLNSGDASEEVIAAFSAAHGGMDSLTTGSLSYELSSYSLTSNSGIRFSATNGIVEGTSGNDNMEDGYDDGEGDIIGDDDGSHDDVVHGGDGDDKIVTGAGADTVEGGAGKDEIYGQTGDDILDGGAGADRVFGGDGEDIIKGGAGSDQLEGGNDDDVIEGGDDDDLIYGGAGDDTVSGQAGDDSVHGGAGDDVVSGGAGEDYLYGGGGNDVLDGGADGDCIYAGDGHDVVYGGSGSDYIEGNAGNDKIDGGTGDDNIKGGAGDDNIKGGTGDDWLTGGTGNDTFVFAAGDGDDYITDFGTQDGTATDGDNSNNDVIDLSAFYNQTNYNAAVANGDIDGTVIKNPLQWLQADLADDGKINASKGDTGFATGDSITLSGVSAASLTYENTRVLCLARGTMVKTSEGARLVEDLTAGDMILTHNNGYQPVRLALSRVISSAELMANPAFCPVIIRQGALGAHMPSADLRVSPQHRMLASSIIAKRMFDDSEVLISAGKLLELDGIEVDKSITTVEYFHLIFDRHEIIFANDCPTESFYLGAEALKSLPDEALTEVVALFPEIMKRKFTATAARQIPQGAQQKQFIYRTAKNNQSFCAISYA